MIIIVVVAIVGIILAVMVLGTILMAGVTFLWAQSYDDTTVTTYETMNVRGTIDASEDLLYLEVISGSYTWGDYRVTVDGTPVTLTSSQTTSAGGTATFTGGEYTAGTVYNVKIVEIAADRLLWDNDIIAAP